MSVGEKVTERAIVYLTANVELMGSLYLSP